MYLEIIYANDYVFFSGGTNLFGGVREFFFVMIDGLFSASYVTNSETLQCSWTMYVSKRFIFLTQRSHSVKILDKIGTQPVIVSVA